MSEIYKTASDYFFAPENRPTKIHKAFFEPTKKNTPAGDLLNKVQAQIKINMEKLQND